MHKGIDPSKAIIKFTFDKFRMDALWFITSSIGI